MTAVLATPPYLAFYDNDGNPLAGGLVYTYAAGTTTPKATYTDDTGLVQMPNPIVLDASGRSTWWLIGSYKYVVKDALGNTIRTTDNVTAFTTLADANDAYFETFSGNGTQTVFTTSQDLGTEEKGLDIEIFTGLQVLQTNGNFATDTDWTKGAGVTITGGQAVWTGAVSTALSQPATFTIVEGQAYRFTYTIPTRSAGGLIPSIGGVSGVERTAAGTYNEVIIAGSTQTLAFTGNAFTGTLDNVSINLVTETGWSPIDPNAYTINGTSLTFAVAPPVGTNNIQVRAPALLLGAASAAAAAAEASATAALASEVAAAASAVEAADSALSAAAYDVQNRWIYSDNTSMANPSTGNIRFNDTAGIATAIAISDLSANAGNPDVSGWIDIWDGGSGSNRGTLYIYKDESNFVFHTINGGSVDNSGWFQLSVTALASAGSFVDGDALFIGFAASGETSVTGGITALTGDVTASGSGSVAATIPNNTVTNAKLADMAANTVKVRAAGTSGDPIDLTIGASQLLGRGASGDVRAVDFSEIGGTVDTSSVLAATAGATVGAVGTYAFLVEAPATTSNYVAGGTLAGSSLRYSAVGNANPNATQANNWVSAGGTPAGTWRAMGTAVTNSSYEQASLWLRIS